MAYLLDSGILLRLIDKSDALHPLIEGAVDRLIIRQETLVITTQNTAELWNVATRPVANNGLGLSPKEVKNLYDETIVPICGVVDEIELAHSHFLRILFHYNVSGKQVHDARLVAMMLAWQIESILTLNDRDFRRYEPEGIKIVTPAELIATP
jgi:predicted nucleic acid-binding protein